MKKLLIAFALASLVAAPTFADTVDKNGRCHATENKGSVKKGQFIPCTTKAVAASVDIKKDANGKCHWTNTTKDHKKGQFAKCP